MKKVGIIFGGIAIMLMVAVLIGGLVMWNSYKAFVIAENGITAQITSNKNEYSTMWNSFREQVQVTELQARQIKEIYTDLIAGRYDDPNLLFKAVQEQNPTIDTSIYGKIQEQIAVDRKHFKHQQDILIDKIREYNNLVQLKPISAAILQKQTKDPNVFIIVAKEATDAFNSGTDTQIDLTNSSESGN